MGHLGSPTRPAGVQISTRRRDHRDSPSPDSVLSLSVRDLFAFLRTQSGGGLASEQDYPVDSSRGGSLSANPAQTRSRPQHAHPREETLGADTSGHQATRGTAKPPRGHRTFAPSCVGPQSTQVAPAARSARDLGPSASINYPLATPVATKASSGSQGPLRPSFPPQLQQLGTLVLSGSRTGYHSLAFVRSEVGTSAPHHSGFCGLPIPNLSHPPREATYPRFITDYSESGEDLFRSSPYSITEPGPSRARSRTQSLHCRDSGSCRVPSPPDFLEDEATPGSAVTADALLEPVLPHFVTAAQPNEKADDEVLLLTIAPSEALWEMRVFSIAPRGCGKTEADVRTALTPLGPPVRWVRS
ncbi:hypothetical protein ACOMHN_061049 [Nucella lapillus]